MGTEQEHQTRRASRAAYANRSTSALGFDRALRDFTDWAKDQRHTRVSDLMATYRISDGRSCRDRLLRLHARV